MHNTKRILSLFLALLMLAGSMSALPAANAAAQSASVPEGNSVSEAALQEAAAGELLVSFSDTVSNKKIEKTIRTEDAEVEDIVTIGAFKLAQVSVETDPAETAQAIAENRLVASVQPNYRYTVAADDPYIGGDVMVRNQYQFAATNALDAWTQLESGTHAKTTVAVVDTGVDLLHEDLQENMIRQDGKYAHFAFGDLEMIEDDVDEDDGHGTHVSGIIGATYGNDLGGSGIASGHENNLIELMTVSASADGYSLYTLDIVKAIEYAVEHGAKVVNMSFGSAGRDMIMEGAIQDAYYNKNVVFVAASGNEDDDGYSSPSDIKEVISVNAANRAQEPTYYSNYGTEKDILAPGNEIMSTLPGDEYGNMSGTSMASPVVAGIAALVLDANPDLTPAQVYNILCASAKKVAYMGAQNFDTSAGYGLIDALAAVQAAKAASAAEAVQEVLVKNDTVSLYETGIYGAEALVLPATSLAPLSWSVANPAIAEVDPVSGVITAKKAGETTLTVSAGGKSATQTIVVNPFVELEDIILTDYPQSGEMGIGELYTIDAKMVPEDATFQDVYLKTSDESVVSVSDNIIIAKKSGSATISLESWDGKVKKSFPVVVKPVAQKVKFTRSVSWITVDESCLFEAKAYDSEGNGDVAGAKIVYTSSDEKVFTIDKESGMLLAKGVGKAYVTARNPYSAKMAVVPVAVVQKDYAGGDYALKQTKATKDSVSLSWKEIPSASGYQVEYKVSGGTWKKLTTLSANTTTYRQIRLKAGTLYSYRIKALYKKDGETKAYSYSTAVLAKTVPDYRLKQAAKTKNSITVRWNKAPSAGGYQIQYRTSKTAAWKALKTVNAKTLSFKHTKLKAGSKYYYRVRAMYKVSGTWKYFDYSSALLARTAK